MYTIKQKRYLLCRLIELYVQNGYSINDLIGRPLSYFDFSKVEKIVNELSPNFD